jgi:inosine-uridine nucleoside N-ribohydrolase
MPVPLREDDPKAATLHHASHIPTPKFTIKEEHDSAVVWLIKTLLASEDGEITLIPVGPLTNIALAMRADPRIIPKIREIVIMGGGTEGNVTPSAEYNVWVDPEAMEIVLQSGCKITLCTLDATHAGYLTKFDAEEIRSIGTANANMVADLILKYGAGGDLANEGLEVQRIPIHDALAVCSVLYPEVLKTVSCCCHTDISRGFAYGQTIMDKRPGTQEPHNCFFALDADRELFRDWIIDVLKKDKAANA